MVCRLWVMSSVVHDLCTKEKKVGGRSVYFACMCIYCLHNNALFWAAYDVIPTISGKSLLASGLWGWCRHPNYFGWILIDVAAAMTCGMISWCFAVLGCCSMVPLWPPHMAQHCQLLADNINHYFIDGHCRVGSRWLIITGWLLAGKITTCVVGQQWLAMWHNP